MLVLDEAQTVSAENMETLTHISNLQTQSSKLIQIVLLAQPNADTLELLRYRMRRHTIICEDAVGAESMLRQMYASCRIKGEWFRLNSGDIASLLAIETISAEGTVNE